MNIYQHRASITASSGSTSSDTLNVRGGLLRQVLVTANTSTTVFRANLVDANSVTVSNWGFHTGQINDMHVSLPVSGRYTLNITNASPDDTFTVLLGIQE